jgi:hypothetical protein
MLFREDSELTHAPFLGFIFTLELQDSKGETAVTGSYSFRGPRGILRFPRHELILTFHLSSDEFSIFPAHCPETTSTIL